MTFPFSGILAGIVSGSTVMSFTSQTNKTATGSTISTSGLLADDIFVLFDVAVNTDAASAPTSVVPSGFTSLKDVSATGGGIGWRMVISWKKLTGSEGTITGMSDNKMQKVGLPFRANRSIVTTTASTWNGEATAGNPALQTVNASGQVAPLIVFGYTATMATAAGAFTESPSFVQGGSGGGSGSTIGYRYGFTIYNEGDSPSDQTVDVPDSGDNVLGSGYLRFT